jgi:hypothetical protein
MKICWEWIVGITMVFGIFFLLASQDVLIVDAVLIFLMLVAVGAGQLLLNGEYEAIGKSILHFEAIVVVILAMFGFWSFPHALPLGHVLAGIFALEIGITIYIWLLNRVIKARYQQPS